MAKGFTLIEMLVTLAVLALIMALVPAYLAGSRDRVELKSAARAVAAALRETREEALAHNRPEAFVIDLDRGWFRGAAMKDEQPVPSGIGVTLVTTAEDQRGAGRGAIRFFPDGSSTGGGVILARGTGRYDVLVDWLTGRVTFAEIAHGTTR
jgi:general secretion pathway protein H